MNKNLNFMMALFVVGSFVFLGVALGKYSSKILREEEPNATCIVAMKEVIASAQGDVYNMQNAPDYVEPAFHYLVTYSVNGDAISDPTFESVPNDLKGEQKDSALQSEAWKIFTNLIPPQNRQMVAQYSVFTDGNSNTLAAVDQTKDDLSKWILEIDIADLADKDALVFNLVHEYAHCSRSMTRRSRLTGRLLTIRIIYPCKRKKIKPALLFLPALVAAIRVHI